MKTPSLVLGPALFIGSFSATASAAEDFSSVLARLAQPDIGAFPGSAETHADGSVCFRWTAAAGYSDRLEFGDGLNSWTPVGSPVYGFGHPVQVKLLDPPEQTQGGGGNGEPAPEFLALDAVVNVFSDNRLLLSFSAGGECVKVLLPLDFTAVMDRPFFGKTFDRPDPKTDVQMVLFFQERAWLPHYDDYDLAGLTLSPEAQEKVDTFLAFAPSIHAELLLPPGGNTAAEGQLSGPPGARGFVRVIRRHTDADRDGIADALEFAGLAGFPDLLLDPFAQDADGDGVPDFVQAVAAIGERTRPGGGEIDPTAPPPPAYSPTRPRVLPSCPSEENSSSKARATPSPTPGSPPPPPSPP